MPHEGVDLTPYIEEIEREIGGLCGLRFSHRELDYLRSWRFLKSDFVDLLGLFHLDQRFVSVRAVGVGGGRIGHHDRGSVAAHHPV